MSERTEEFYRSNHTDREYFQTQENYYRKKLKAKDLEIDRLKSRPKIEKSKTEGRLKVSVSKDYLEDVCRIIVQLEREQAELKEYLRMEDNYETREQILENAKRLQEAREIQDELLKSQVTTRFY